LSFLSVEGAINVGMEIFSLSKSYNMTGWRMAFAAGHPKLIKAYATVKDNTDSGQFRAIQKAAIRALDYEELTAKNAERYSRRFDLLVPALNRVGFSASKPGATFYCYVKSPVAAQGGEVQFANAEEAAEYLIREAVVSTVPWDDAGSWLRFSATFSAETPEDEEAVIAELEKRLTALRLVF
jgi:LL-diaminopimelate aminotransferase